MPYLEPTNLTGGIYGLFEYSNKVTDNSLGYTILITIYITLFLYLINKGWSAPESAVSVGFFTSIIGIILSLLNLITTQHLYITISVGLLAPIAWLYFSDSR